tara:strand:- start:44 stop:226 length:183 start_codon:yes stop_codon:yes gene_type:complete
VYEREERELWFTTYKEQKLDRKRETRRERVLKERKRETQWKKARKSPHHGEEIFKNHIPE